MSSEQHPSRRTLERLSVEDLPAGEREVAAGHVAACARCGAIIAELGAMKERQLATLPPELLMARVAAQRDQGAELASRRSRRSRGRVLALASVGVLAVAAGLVLVPRLLVSPTGSSDLPADDVRLKGEGAALLRRRGGEVVTLADGATMRAGDEIEVAVTLARPARVAIWFLDARGALEPLLDDRSGGVVELAAGRQVAPGSARIDAPCLDTDVVVARGDEITGVHQALQRIAAERATGGAGAPKGVALPTLRGAWSLSLRCE